MMKSSIRGSSAWQTGSSPAWFWSPLISLPQPRQCRKSTPGFVAEDDYIWFCLCWRNRYWNTRPCCVRYLKALFVFITGKQPVIISLSSQAGSRAQLLCPWQAACFQAWSLGQPPVACSSCWHHSRSTHHGENQYENFSNCISSLSSSNVQPEVRRRAHEESQSVVCGCSSWQAVEFHPFFLWGSGRDPGWWLGTGRSHVQEQLSRSSTS